MQARRLFLAMAAFLLLPAGSAAARPMGAETLSPPAVAAALPGCTIIGTAAADVIVGTARDDVICALGGADSVRGGGGDDTLFGGEGDDRMDGGGGDDRLYGWDGADGLRGGRGDDWFQGSRGADVISGGPGTDIADYGSRRRDLRISLDGGADDGWAGEGDDVDVEDVRTGSGDDVVLGTRAANGLHGGRGDDRLRGGRGNDQLWGDEGNDRLEGRDGNRFSDWLRCGAGGGDMAMGNAPDHVNGCERARMPKPSTPKNGNHPPSGITLSPARVAEDEPAGTMVGTLEADDRDRGQHHAFALVEGAGGADNGAFRIDGSTLRTAGMFDYEAKAAYSIRVRARDDGRPARSVTRVLAVSVMNVNEAPIGIALSHAAVPENEAAGMTVGTLTASDPDAGDRATFALVQGAGDADNAMFQVVGSTLRSAAVYDFESDSSYTIRVRVTDEGSPARWSEQQFTIAITDMGEPPVAVGKTATIDEDSAPTTLTLSASDPEGDDVASFTPSAPNDGTVAPAGSIACSGTPKVCTQDFKFTPDTDFNGTVGFDYTASDGQHDSVPATVAVTVAPVNDTPVASPASLTTAEDAPLTLDLAAVVDDVETSDANLTYEIVAPPAHGTATTTTYTPNPDFNGTDSLTYRVTDRGDPDDCSSAPCDGTETSTTETVSITVAPINDAPQAPDWSRTTAEDTPLSLDLAALASDLETSDANLTYEIVTPPAHGSATATTYTPDANFNGTDSLTYKVTDRGDPDNCSAAPCDPAKSATGTVSITVDPINDAPQATPGSRTTDEDTPLTLNLDALLSDVETSDANLTYEIVTPPAHGIATETTYTPDADFNGTDSLTYKVTDRGDPDDCASAPCDTPETSITETVSITVDPVNDAPLAPDASRTTDEDTPMALDLAALADDVETGDANLTYAVTQPAHGTVTGTGAARTYTPAGDFDGTDSFTYTVTDRGDPDNCASASCDAAKPATGTISITVSAVNDAPVNTVPAGTVSAAQGADAPIAGLSVADVDAGGDDIQVTLAVTNGTLTVSTSVIGGVGTLEVTGNGTKTVVVTASQQAIRATLLDANGLVYHAPASGGPDPLTITTDDQGHNGAGGAKTDTDTVAIVVNSPPVAAAQSVTTNEDTAKTITLSATDADGDALTFAKGTGPSHGTLGPLGPVTCGVTLNTCTVDVLYTPAADYNGPDEFTFTANDGFITSPEATVSITVTAVNDVPQLQGIEGGALPYTENDAATDITDATGVADIDSANFDTGTLTVDYTVGGTADDRLEIRNEGQIAVTGSNITHGGTTIGTFIGGSGTTALVVTLNASATPATVQDLVRAVTYRNVSDNPSAAARTVRFRLTDGDGGTSAAATRAIALAAVNDAPVVNLDAPGGLTYAENAGFQNLFGANATVTDVDSATLDSLTVTVTSGFDAAFDTLELNTAGFTANFASGALTITKAAGTAADFTTALRNVRFRNTDDDPDNRVDGTPNPSAADRTVSAVADDGPDTSAPVTRNITITPVNDAPTATADNRTSNAESALANTTLAAGTSPAGPKVSTASNNLANDTDVDSPTGGLTITPALNQATTRGGTVSILADGTFTYRPPPGITTDGAGSPHDTFTYTLNDNETPNATASGTVTVRIVGPTAWYVDDSAAGGGNGTSNAPFQSPAPLSTGGGSDSLDGTGDRILVYSGTYTSGIALESNQKLLGEPQGLAFTDTVGRSHTLVAAGGTRPALSASTGSVVALGSGNELQDLDLGNAGVNAASLSGTNVGTATVADASINNTAGKAIDIDTGTLAMAFGTVTSTNSGSEGVKLTNAGGTLTVTGGSITNATNADFAISQGNADVSYGGSITDDVGSLVTIANTSGGAKVFSGAISDGNDGDGAGISLTGNAAATTMNFSGGLTLSTGTNPAFTATGGGTVTVTGTNTLASTTGTTLTVTGTTIGDNDLNFRSIASNGASSGIALSNTSNANGRLVVAGNGGSCTSAATCTGGAIQSSTGSGISLTNVPGGASLTRMFVNGSADDGIGGSNVAGLTLDSATVTGNGNANGDNGIDVTQLTGTSPLTNSNVSNNFDSNVYVSNASGTLNLNVTGGAYSGATGGQGDGIFVEGTGTGSQNLNVQGPITFANNVGDHIQHSADADNTTDSDVTINNTTMTSPAAAGGGPTCALNILGGGITVSHGGNAVGGSNVDLTITNNNIQNSCIGAIAVGTTGSVGDQQLAQVDATIENNVIGTAGVAGSGSVQGNGIFVDSNGNSVVRTLITGNTIRQWTNRNGITLDILDGDAEMSATVRGNTLTEPNSAFAGTTTRGMTIQLGSAQAGDSIDACLDIGHATDNALKNTLSDTGEGIQPDVRYLHEGPGSAVQLAGFAGSPNQTDITNWFTARNIFGATPVVSGLFTPPAGATTSGVASCPQPAS